MCLSTIWKGDPLPLKQISGKKLHENRNSREIIIIATFVIKQNVKFGKVNLFLCSKDIFVEKNSSLEC